MPDKEKAHEFATNLNCENMKMGELMALRQGGEIGYLEGIAEGRKETCEKLLEEVRTHDGMEQMTKFYISEIIKNIGLTE